MDVPLHHLEVYRGEHVTPGLIDWVRTREHQHCERHITTLYRVYRREQNHPFSPGTIVGISFPSNWSRLAGGGDVYATRSLPRKFALALYAYQCMLIKTGALPWVSSDGRVEDLSKLDTRHLANIARKIKRDNWRSEWLDAVRAELDRRGALPPEPISKF